jgi:LmbE family N-acetylglucosaminyl deacetylase
MAAPPRLLVVLAHPDDESLACGGTLARCADLGAAITLVCATRGEAGSLNPALDTDRAELAALRTREVQAAAAVLGIARVAVLDVRDGMLPWVPAAPLEAAIAAIYDEVRPDAVIGFGADGLYWHPDHIAIAARTAAVVAARAASHPTTHYEVTMPAGAMAAVVRRLHEQLAGEDLARDFWGVAPEAFGKGALAATLEVDVRGVIDRKLAALRCNRSQLGPGNPLARLDTATAVACLGIEHFHVAPGSPRSQSFLDGLGQG